MDNILDEKGEISFNINDYNITFENGICTIKRKYNPPFANKFENP